MRERRVDSKEKNLEISAVEIKYFKKGHERWLTQNVKNDVKKLNDSVHARVKPRVDNGFFVCIDETGKAEGQLKRLFAKQWLSRYKNICYSVVVPKHLAELRNYPMALEEYEQGPKRSSAYVMDKALGMLKSEFQSLIHESIRFDDIRYKQCVGPWFYIRCKYKRKPIGYAQFDLRFNNGNRITPALILTLDDESHHVGDQKCVKWSLKREGYYYNEESPTSRVYLEGKSSYLYDLNKMNRIADQIHDAVKKILRKAQRK